jgi:hypothetical protein
MIVFDLNVVWISQNNNISFISLSEKFVYLFVNT